MIELGKNYSIIARRMKRSEIRELLKLTNKHDIISFAGGLPDPATFPIEEIKDIVAHVLSNEGKKALQYGETEGDPRLRGEIVKWMARDNIHVTEDHILVTVASQQGLDLVSKVFIDPSDPIIVEIPSYIGGLQAFTSYGANMVGIPIDDEGIQVDILESKLKHLRNELEHYKMIYVVPDFQNPAGITLSTKRREKLIELSDKYKVLILEDTPYRELRFEGTAPPTLYSLDSPGNVIALHTFSKILAPGLRLGWVVAHPEIINRLVVAKQSTDLCTPNFTQAIAYEFCRRGLLENHIEKVKVLYKKKRDIMLKALEEHMPKVEGLKWTKPSGGLFLWLTMPEYVDGVKMFADAIKEKVAYVIGTAFHCDEGGINTMRLNFSYPTEEQIVEGVQRLSKVIKSKLRSNHRISI